MFAAVIRQDQIRRTALLLASEVTYAAVESQLEVVFAPFAEVFFKGKISGEGAGARAAAEVFFLGLQEALRGIMGGV